MTEPKLHPGLTVARWREFTLFEQLANAGSEVIRAIKWRDKNVAFSRMASDRALELLSLTKADPKNRGRLRELCRLYEVTVNDLYGFNDYKPDLPRLEAYFLAYTHLAQKERAARRP